MAYLYNLNLLHLDFKSGSDCNRQLISKKVLTYTDSNLICLI